MQQLTQTLGTALLTLTIGTSTLGDEAKITKQATYTGTQSPHVHGHAKLYIVLEANQLSLELHSPAMNLLGFEYIDNSPEQQVIMENTRIDLANADGLFVFNGAKCTLTQQNMDLSATLRADKKAQTDDNEHNTESSADEHSHEKHQSNNGSHSNIEVTYRYSCEKPDELTSMATRIQNLFPSIGSLQVQWIAHNQQGAVTLSPKRNKIHFR